MVKSGTAIDAFWHVTVEFDPVEMLRHRAKQKIYLARYGRQSVLQWGDVDVTELTEYFEVLSELISEENGGGISEDR